MGPGEGGGVELSVYSNWNHVCVGIKSSIHQEVFLVSDVVTWSLENGGIQFHFQFTVVLMLSPLEVMPSHFIPYMVMLVLPGLKCYGPV